MQSLLNLPFMKKPGRSGTPRPDESPNAVSPPEDDLRLRLYKLIIDRYRDKIEEYETKSVSDLKQLVQPREERVSQLKGAITESFHPYVPVEHFLSAAKLAFSHVSSYRTISAPVSFWLSFSEMQELMAGDEIDKSILLCSLLRALGSQDAKVVVTDSRNSYVLFQFLGKSHVADHASPEILETPDSQSALSLLKGRPLYSFNDADYEDFADG